MRKTKETAYAKINLSLDVLGRLDNGYHIVKMIMQTIDLYDELVFETQDRECSSMEITLATDSGEIPGGEDNLIVRAVRRMEAKYGIRRDLKITLKKNIPVAAGMAGGSTDAAAALRAVRDLFVPEVSDEELQKTGVSLGADIPYCVTGGTQLSEGIGEVLAVLPDAPQCGLVVCKPPVNVSTAEIYKKYDSLEEFFLEGSGINDRLLLDAAKALLMKQPMDMSALVSELEKNQGWDRFFKHVQDQLYLAFTEGRLDQRRTEYLMKAVNDAVLKGRTFNQTKRLTFDYVVYRVREVNR